MTVFWAILAILFFALSGGFLYSISLYRQKNRNLRRQLKQQIRVAANSSAISIEEFQKLKQENLMYRNALNQVRNRKIQFQVSADADSLATENAQKMQLMNEIVRKCKKNMEDMQQKEQIQQKLIQDLKKQIKDLEQGNQSQANEVNQLKSALQHCTEKSSDAKDSQQKLVQDLQSNLRQMKETNSVQSSTLQHFESKLQQYQTQLSDVQQAKADSDNTLQIIREKFAAAQQRNTELQQREKVLLRQVKDLQNQLQNQINENQQYSAKIQELKKTMHMYKTEVESAQKVKSAYADLQQKYQEIVKEQDHKISQEKAFAERQSAIVQQNEAIDDRRAEYYRILCTETKALNEISSVVFLSVSVSLSGEPMISLSSNYRSAQVSFLECSRELIPNPYCFSHLASDGETMQSLNRLESVFEMKTRLYPECRYKINKIIPAKCQCDENEYTLLEKGQIWLDEM